MNGKYRYKLRMLEQAREFVYSLPQPVRNKIIYNTKRVQTGQFNNTIFKKLEGSKEIWEIRTRLVGNIYRLFAFFDKYTGDMIVATHGLIKKMQKTPKKEIVFAEKIMKEYYKKNYPKI